MLVAFGFRQDLPNDVEIRNAAAAHINQLRLERVPLFGLIEFCQDAAKSWGRGRLQTDTFLFSIGFELSRDIVVQAESRPHTSKHNISDDLMLQTGTHKFAEGRR